MYSLRKRRRGRSYKNRLEVTFEAHVDIFSL